MQDPEDFILRFRHQVPEREGGAEVLDIACGEGRHALFFARSGCRVTAMDRSPEALEVLRSRAGREGLPVRAVEADVENMSLVTECVDVVVNTLFLYRPLFDQYVRALRPGGVLYFRTFTTDQADVLGRPHPRREFQLAPSELRRAFDALRIVHYEESVTRDRAVASLVAVRPEASAG